MQPWTTSGDNVGTTDKANSDETQRPMNGNASTLTNSIQHLSLSHEAPYLILSYGSGTGLTLVGYVVTVEHFCAA